ncbi:MAG: ATP-NAD kinase [Chloroflexi bacterium]|nr:ATP-NAD kinase [Chloroflexota bacterium]
MEALPLSVGIIPNPVSGSDIRRLVALGTVYGTQDKINIVQRILVGLSVVGIDVCYLMPDAYHIGEAALSRLPKQLRDWQNKVKIIDMPVENCAEDSIYAAKQMNELGVGCIIVLGGDGTSRVVARGCKSTPILPISTGTNNVIPYLVEGTVAGMAAGFVAYHPELIPEISYRSKWLNICMDGNTRDIALVDIAILNGQVIGSKAIWQLEDLDGAIFTRAEAKTTGITSLAGFFTSLSPLERRGLYLRFGEPVICQINAPLAPGLITSIGIKEKRDLSIGDCITVTGPDKLLALDGEREILVSKNQTAEIYLQADGPWVIDVYKALELAAQRGFFIH